MIFDAFELAAPLMLAAMGGLLTEYAGVLNIALEGMLLTGAFAAYAFTFLSGSIIIGMVAAGVITMIPAAITALVHLKLKANLFITGLGTNLLAMGLIPFISKVAFNTKGVIHSQDFPPYPKLVTSGDTHIPLVSDIVLGHSVIVYIAWGLFIALLLYLPRSALGLRLKACGYNQELLRIRGIKPERYKWLALLLSGAFTGLGGAALSLSLGSFIPNISAGRGWIALAAVFLGFKRPFPVVLACLLFALAENFAGYLQGIFRVAGSGTILWSLPYIITVIALVVVSIIRTRRSRGRDRATR